jgi:hypothetical protein
VGCTGWFYAVVERVTGENAQGFGAFFAFDEAEV